MGRSVTPTFRVEIKLASPAWAATPEAWKSREYGRPSVIHLERFIRFHNLSLEPGGANEHLDRDAHRIVAARIVRQATGDVVAEVAWS